MSISLRVAFAIIITGLFVIVAFAAVNYDTLNQNFYLILVPVTGFLFFFGFAIGENFVGPVKKILKETGPLEKGNGRTRLYLKTNDEIGELAKTFNKIAEKFEEHKSKIESLDMNVKLRTRALEEIISVLEQKVKNRTADWRGALEELEQAHALVAVKDKEIMDLHHQLAKNAKRSKKKT